MQTNSKKNHPTTPQFNSNNRLHELLYAIFETQSQSDDSDAELELEVKVDKTGNVTDLELVSSNKT